MSKSSAAASPWPTRDQRSAEREAKREAVLRAAAQEFSMRGYHATSLDDIALRLGVTKPTLYYYAKSKGEMLEAVNSSALEEILNFDPSEGRTEPLEQLLALIRRYAEVVATDFGRCLVRVLDSDLAEGPRETIREARQQIHRRIEELLARGVEAGQIAPCDTKMTAFMIGGSVNWIGHWYDEAGGLSPQEIAASFSDQIAVGLLPRS